MISLTQQAVRLVLDEELTPAAAAAQLGINKSGVLRALRAAKAPAVETKAPAARAVRASKAPVEAASPEADAIEVSGQLTNAEFIAAIFPPGSAVTCTKHSDPDTGGWIAKRDDEMAKPGANNYISCSSYKLAPDGSVKAQKALFAACHFIMLDDVGSKVDPARLSGLKLSWLIETSPGNHQGGIILKEPMTDGKAATALLKAVIDAGLCDAGASSPMTRWARLPVAINGKPKYAVEGEPFRCKLVEWNPECRYTPEEVIAALSLDMEPAKGGPAEGEVYEPRAGENPVITALKARGMYKAPLGGVKHDITCPWVTNHTDGKDSGTAYFEPDADWPLGGFKCLHTCSDKYHLRDLLAHLSVSVEHARHKPVIRINSGDMVQICNAAERELAASGHYYQTGGLITRIRQDAKTGNPAIEALGLPELTRALALSIEWLKFDGRSSTYKRSDPPIPHLNMMFGLQDYARLPHLTGLAMQPYFHESGTLITEPGYDEGTQRFGIFNPNDYPPVGSTREEAEAALALIESTLSEFCFASDTDKTAALAAILTAATRQSFALAPAFHVRAPCSGSGKSYLCELITVFALAGEVAKISYPTTAEEATKVMLAVLLSGSPVIEFDDMASDWIPHGVINRMLTSPTITERILGISKTATVSTRALVLGSGNNVGPVRDLARRVLTIQLDTKTETPATRKYAGDPVAAVRVDRGRYVSAALTIVNAWRHAGAPPGAVTNLASYDGEWTDFCRHPLVWLGKPDPAGGMAEQLRHDPDAEVWGVVLKQWYAAFGCHPTTIREALLRAKYLLELQDALAELPVMEQGVINTKKLGWAFRKHAQRVVGRHWMEPGETERTWCVHMKEE